MNLDSRIAEIATKVGVSVDEVMEAYNTFMNAKFSPEESLILTEYSFIMA